MQSRRRLLGILGGGLSTALFGSASSFSTLASATALTDTDREPRLWWLLDPLQAGSTLEDGWFIQTLEPVSKGAAVLTLAHENHDAVRIHICLYAVKPKGFAHSELFDLIVMDHGAGVGPVLNDLSHTLKRLEFIIRDNEIKGLSKYDIEDISQLMTHIERVDAFGHRSLG